MGMEVEHHMDVERAALESPRWDADGEWSALDYKQYVDPEVDATCKIHFDILVLRTPGDLDIGLPLHVVEDAPEGDSLVEA